MILIVGLGNPGKKFEKTRHNVGFWVVEEFFREKRKANFFSDFKFKKKLKSLISEGKINNEKIILAKPQTFMNLSGQAAKLLADHFSIDKRKIFVIHDDIDLPLGKIKISFSRGAAGHKGVQSIIEKLGTKDFVRFRIGIQPKTRRPKNLNGFVLQKFGREEKIIKRVIRKTIEAIEFSIKEGVEKAMTKYNA